MYEYEGPGSGAETNMRLAVFLGCDRRKHGLMLQGQKPVVEVLRVGEEDPLAYGHSSFFRPRTGGIAISPPTAAPHTHARCVHASESTVPMRAEAPHEHARFA